MSRLSQTQKEYYRGVPMVRYDLLKEIAIVTAVLLVMVAALALVFSSPDSPSVTVKSWAQTDAVDFVTTATSELSGQSASAQYGGPYNTGTTSVQALGPISPQGFAGVHVPIDSANDFVLDPLHLASSGNADLTAALSTYTTAT
ncbi:MAG TPA: cytochrome B6, partial [Candidatus Dormibacteraeota bacterium]|nr:cytochrome B6 [Candidatus Dormibacteraeota bacterium]